MTKIDNLMFSLPGCPGYKGNPPTSETEFNALFGADNPWPNKPSWAFLENELARLQAEYDAKQYQRDRAAEYPPITDYLDGVVKGDQAQIDKYIADCLAVKAKYPKPTA